ncbi:telomeric DNA-binding factor trf1 [Nannizzia gypsea CBS 118893]|uniref:Telomeric DNA-binding factor trf1 n=1 Tax=Arthroderma gypseum (strain ATCC MYA-4604 / CBS 118893) TaxID=535722 RepID=E4UMR5_ARTGP|nr:telomeric DNA-binding factor trf1 [Nannizzia gypsea CBS 118893]EFR00269.1 telomeric DNA-binding factor trf1 [Nannizzia gypsea CBS 118893]
MPEGQPVSMTDHPQAGDPPIDDKSAAVRPASVATPVPDSNEQPKQAHPLQDDDASLAPDPKRRRTDTPTGADIADDAAEEGTIPFESHRLALSESYFPVKGDVASGTSQSVEPGPVKEELGDLRIPTTHAASPESVAHAISHLLDQSRRKDTSKQAIPVDSNAALLKANSNLKAQSLPILDNLSTQILCFIARTSFQDLTSLVSEPQSENSQSYSTLRSLFDHTKKVYTTSKPFLSASELGFTDASQVEVVRKANLASFVFSLFGSQEIGFSELHDNFLDIFVPEGGRLLKSQAALFLELKTQTFIASMNNPARPKVEILYELFPDHLGVNLLARRPGTRHPAPSETDFVKRAHSRRDILLGEINNPDSIHTLPEKYLWQDFLRDISVYVSKNIDSLTTQTKRPNKTRSPTSPQEEEVESPATALETQFPVAPPAPPEPAPIERRIGRVDLAARAARAAQIALQGQGVRRASAVTSPPLQQPQPQQQQSQQQTYQPAQPYTQPTAPQSSPPPPPVQQPAPQATSTSPPPPPPQSQPSIQPSYTHYAPTPTTGSPQPSHLPFLQGQFQFQQYSPQTPTEPSTGRNHATTATYGYMPGVPHYSQSEPTQILYERARLATTTRSSPSSRRAGLPSQRRPWTTEEENALMAGLDRVKGPHWSQILSMFGPGGTISEALKDRNQVQLKDKARNLKLFFLKSGIEVPYYLKFVTGELKTRAPAQAAKQEARERERQQGEEDKAHVEGIEGMMALAGAHASASVEPSIGGVESHPNTQPGTPAIPTQQQEPPNHHHHPHHQDDQDQHAAERSAEQVLYQSLTQEKAEGLQMESQRNYVDPSL